MLAHILRQGLRGGVRSRWLLTSTLQAIKAKRCGANGADAKNAAYKTKCHEYWFTLGDNPGDRPYRAGGVVLNPLIEAIRTYGAVQPPHGAGCPQEPMLALEQIIAINHGFLTVRKQ